MSPAQLTYEVADRVATISLDRPDQLNAFTVTMADELCDAFDEVDADDDVRAVVVTGRGRAFCAGADLADGTSSFAADPAADHGVHRDEGGLVSLRIFECTKPVIAAVNGAAVGVGVTMTLPMDVRLASENARFGFVFARRGLVPEAASSWFLPRLVGIDQALEWCLTGRVFPATEALAGGLVRRVVAPGDLLDAAHGLAREIAEQAAPVSAALTRRMLWRMLGAAHPMEAHRVDSRALDHLRESSDLREGVESYLEKRPPRFTMRVSRDLPDVFPDWEAPTFR